MKRIVVAVSVFLLAVVALSGILLMVRNTDKEAKIPAYIGNNYPDVPKNEATGTGQDPAAQTTSMPTEQPAPTVRPTKASDSAGAKQTSQPTVTATPTGRPTEAPMVTPVPTNLQDESNETYPFTNHNKPDVPKG